MIYATAGGTTGTDGMGYPGLFPASTLDIFTCEEVNLENISNNWVISYETTHPWTSLAVSSSGQYQIVCNTNNSDTDGISYSGDYGKNWTNITTSSAEEWKFIAMSSTGQYQTVSTSGSSIYNSTTFGKSWFKNSTSFTYTCKSISISASGMYQSLCTNNSSGSGYIYTSNDYGVTWTRNTTSSLNKPWTSINISKSGQYQTVCYGSYGTSYGEIYVSSSYGNIWRKIVFSNTTNNWQVVCVSDSGQYQTANNSSYIWISNDYGNTWTQISETGSSSYNGTTSLSMSSSGQYQVGAGSSNYYIIYSSDYGNTWGYIDTITDNTITSISMSSSGQYITFCTGTGFIWTCINSIVNGVVSVGNYSSTYTPSYGVTGSLYYNTTYAGASGLQISTGSTWASVKSFVIEHPDDSEKYLVHGCLEGPEAGVYYRGRGEISNDEFVEIKLPDYVKNLATELTVQITPIYEGKKITTVLSATEIIENVFRVYGDNCKFHWTVFGQRAPINVEVDKNAVSIKGDGPYRWI